MKLRWALIVALIFSGFSIVTKAGGTDYTSNVGAKTLSLNGLYFAGNDGLSSIISNPSGLGSLSGLKFELSVMDKLGLHQFENKDIGLHRSFRKDDLNFYGGLYWNLSPEITIGGYYGRVYDNNVNWPYALLGADNSTILAFDMFNHIKVNTISPAVSFKLDNLVIGLAFNIYNVSQETAFPQKNNSFNSGNGLYAYQINFNQKGWGYGINLGVTDKISEDLNLGFVVKSPFTVDLKGDAMGSMFAAIDSTAPTQTTVSSKFQMPWIIGAGILYKLDDFINLNVDFQYSMYGSLNKNQTIEYGNNTWQNNLTSIDSVSGINGSEFSLNYKNKIDCGIGIEFINPDGVNIRASYKFSQSPNSESSYNFLYPEVSRHCLSIGFGFKDGPYILDAGLTYSIGSKKDVQSSSLSKFSGKYSSDGYYPTVTLRYEIF